MIEVTRTVRPVDCRDIESSSQNRASAAITAQAEQGRNLTRAKDCGYTETAPVPRRGDLARASKGCAEFDEDRCADLYLIAHRDAEASESTIARPLGGASHRRRHPLLPPSILKESRSCPVENLHHRVSMRSNDRRHFTEFGELRRFDKRLPAKHYNLLRSAEATRLACREDGACNGEPAHDATSPGKATLDRWIAVEPWRGAALPPASSA